MARRFFVYILASRYNGTLYIGVTNDLGRRVFEHRQGRGSRFTARYGVTRLVYYEEYDDPNAAIEQETRMKRWERAWKIRLIEETNPGWDDLYDRLNW